MNFNLFKLMKESLKQAKDLSKVEVEHAVCPYCGSKHFTLASKDLVHTYKKVHTVTIPNVVSQYCTDCRQITPTPGEAQRLMQVISTFNKEVDKQNALQNFTRETSKSPFVEGGVIVLLTECDNHIWPQTSNDGED